MQSVFGAVLCAVVLIIFLSTGAFFHTGRRLSFIAEYLEETQVSTSDKKSFMADLISSTAAKYGRINADQNEKLHAYIPADDLEVKKLAQGILQGHSNRSDRNGSPPSERQGKKKTETTKKVPPTRR